MQNKNFPVAVAVDLFCGVGGLTRGLLDADIAVKAGFDSDQSCEFAYKSNNQVEFVCKDICEIEASDIAPYWGDAEVRILVGCAPCQPFSPLQSNRADAKNDDEKWGLLKEFSRLARETEAEIVSMENVPHLKKCDIYDRFVSDLEADGFEISVQTVPCAKYGVPQTRRRLVLLASKRGKIKLVDPDSAFESTVKAAIGNLAPAKKPSDAVGSDPAHVAYNLSDINMERIQSSRPGCGREIWDERLAPKSENTKKFPSPYGRMSWDALAPTITANFCYYSCGRFGHPEADRAISIREGALLQTFPQKYRFFDFSEGKERPALSTLARHIGNAVPPALGRAIGKSILIHMHTQKEEKHA